MIRHARMLGRPTLFLPGLDHASHRRPVRARRDPRQGGREPGRRSAASATSSGCTRSSTTTRERHPRPAAARRRHRATGAACGSRWTRSAPGPSASRVRAALPRGPGLPDRGARQLVPGLPDERQRPRGHPDARDRHALERPLPPDRRGDRRCRTRTRRSPSRRPAPRRSSATPRSPSTPTTRATRRSSAAASGSRSSSATCRSSPTTVVDRAFGTGAVKITPAHDHDDHETGVRHGLPMPTILDDDARVANTGTRLRRPRPLRGARARSLADLEARGDLVGEQPHEMVIGRCQRSNDVVEPRLKTQWFVRTGAARRSARSRRPASGRTRILPERFEKVWEHWLTNIRDWNVSRQLWWGHRIPAWYCPDGHVDGQRGGRAGRAACEVCGRPAARAAPGPGHLRHLVQLRAVAVLDARLAGRDRRPAPLLPGLRHGDGLRHHLLLGRPDDDAGHRADRRRAVPHGLPVGPDPRPVRPEDVEDEGQRRRPARDHRRGRAPTPSASPWSTGPRPATTSGSGRPSSRTPATSRTSCGTRRASCSARARRRSRRARSGGCRTRPGLGPAERWMLSRAAATTAAVDRAMADYAFGEVTRLLYDGHLERVLRLGPRAGQGPARRRLAPGRRARGDLVDAGRGPRHVPAPAPPGHAVHHRAAVGGAAAPGHGPGAADRRPLAGSGRARRGGRGGRSARSSSSSAAVRNARADAKLEPGAWLPLDVYVEPELGPALEALRPGARAARPRATAAPAPDPRGPARDRGRRRRAGRDRRAGRGGRRAPASPIPAPPRRTARASRRSWPTPSACSTPRGPAWPTRRSSARRRRPSSTGARAREAELADQVERLRERLGR